MKMQRKPRSLFLTLAVFLLSGFVVRAEVATHGDEPGDQPVVVLETNRITEEEGPIGSVWQPESEPSERIRVLNSEGATREDERPSIMLHPQTRMPIAAWPRRIEAGYDIVISRFVAGAWSEAEIVTTGDSGTLDTFLTADPDTGVVHLLYRTGGDTPHVEHRSASPGAANWSAPTVVSAPGEIGVRPSATWHSGRLFVVYEVHLGVFDSASRQIVVAEHDGASWLREVVTSTNYDGRNDPQIHTAGTRVWVDWIDAPGVMSWTCREDGGSWTSLEAESFSGAEDREYHVRGRIKRDVRDR